MTHSDTAEAKNPDWSQTYRLDNVRCPYCSWENEDSWEITADIDEYQCGKCEKAFSVQVHHETTFSTRPL